MNEFQQFHKFIEKIYIKYQTKPMDSSRKSYKALSMAQPIKKDIDQTLTKLQLEKRKFLSLQREESTLRQQIQKARRQLNEAKLIEPKIRVKQNKNIQTNMSINNADRIYLNTLNKITQYKVKIDVHRKQIDKYKKLSKGLEDEIHRIEKENNQVEAKLLKRQDKNQTVKDNLMEYRNKNIQISDEFKNSFQALHKSSVKQENERKKSQALRKGFQYEELKNSKLINLAEVETHSTLNQAQNIPKNDHYMTNCIPLVKQRVRILIHNNKQKLKISQNYRKFGEQLESMFQIMKEYKGRDDVSFIADEFVMKQKQLKKIEQYIGKLQNRLMFYKQQMEKIKRSDQTLKEQINKVETEENKINDLHYVQLQKQVTSSIQDLKHKITQNTDWLSSISKILLPLLDGQEVNRGNVDKMLGIIEEKFFKEEKPIQSYQQKPAGKHSKVVNPPTIDEKEIKSTQSMELMSYERLKDYAKEYITYKK